MTVNINKPQINLREQLKKLERPAADKLAVKGHDGVLLDPLTGELSLQGIDSIQGGTAVDVFVYDTSKDSDGGAWRKRTQNTSWYNETLGTTTRGNRREFPAVAVIVAEYEKITIYDADDSTLPMWMVFNYGASHGPLSAINMLYANGEAVAALNGVLCSVGTIGWHDGLTAIDFIKDSARWRNNSNVADWYNGIANRNVAGGYGAFYNTSSMYLVGANVTDVEMAVLPDATEDDISKLPIPVIATANNGGTSLIKENGTVIDFNDAIGAGRPAATTTIRGNDIVHWNVNNGTLQQFFNALSATADSNNDVKYNYTSGGGHNSCENVSALLRKAGDGPFYLATRSPKSIAAAAQSGLSIFVDGTTRSFSTNNPSIFDTRVAYITSDYNTGWMYGDIRLATLSETTTDPAGLPLNIVSNGTFDSNVDGWSLRGSGTEPTHSNGKLQLTGNSSWHVIKFTRNYNFIAGEEYFIIFTMGGTSSRGVVDYSGGVFYPTTGSNYYYPSAAGTYVVKYTPNSATPDLAFVFNNTSGDTGTLDNVSIAPAIKDRSLKAGCLAVFGTINRNKANSNGDLVSYSGFSSSSYIEQQFNASTMNHGTGDFCYCFWVNLTSAGNGNQTFIDRSSANNQTTSPRLRIHQMDAAGHVRLYTDGGSATGTKTSILNVGWTQIVALRRSGTLELYINGNLEKSASSSTDFSSTAGQVRVGLDGDGTDPLNNGSISLLRISASAPTAEQIKEMYNEESCFFYANGKATLYGSSDAVTAVAYDDTTSLLHVGTSDGRSVFSGLKRVENTTTAVTTAISASNGLVVEQ